MKVRKRKYRCPRCKKIVTRISDKQWIKSDCDQYEKGVYVGTFFSRLILVKK